MLTGSTFESELLEALKRMRECHSGEELLRAATVLSAGLPMGPVVLVSTSVEGAAIAAVIAALSTERDLSWHLLNLSRPPQLPEGQVVVVEPVDAGEGWRQAVEESLPGASVLIAPA